MLDLKHCSGVTLTPDVMGDTFQNFSFCLVSLHSIFPKVLGSIKMFSGKLETSLNVSFDVWKADSKADAKDLNPFKNIVAEHWM